MRGLQKRNTMQIDNDNSQLKHTCVACKKYYTARQDNLDLLHIEWRVLVYPSV
jgi:hypothetical protein